MAQFPLIKVQFSSKVSSLSAATSPLAKGLGHDFPQGRILCTEDDPDTRDLLKLTLELAGYEVSCTHDPEVAIQRVKNEKFDLCLMDNWMPGVSGEDLCRAIREFDKETPIPFYSGAAFECDKQRAKDAGAQGYLVKPVSDDQLLAEVMRVIAEAKIAFP